MEIKITDDFKNVFQNINTELAKTYIDTVHRLILNLTKLERILVTEEDFVGVVEDGMDYPYYQLAVIEDDILSNLDVSAISKIEMISGDYLLGRGDNVFRITAAMKTTRALIHMLEDYVDEYLPLEEEQMLEFKELLTDILRNTIFPFLKELGVIDSFRGMLHGGTTFYVNVHLNDYLTQRGYDVYEESKRLHSLISKYPILLDTSEVLPEVWDDFIANAPVDYVGHLLENARVVKVMEIKKFFEGELIIDDEYITVLEKRSLAEELRNIEGEI